MNQIKRRIMKEGQIVKAQTELGTAVNITKKEACWLLDTLVRRGVEPAVSFTEIRPGKFLVIIEKKVSN